MGTHYNQLTFKDRTSVEALSELGFSARKMAIKMGRSNKTVATELKRCPKGEYCAQEAHDQAMKTKGASRKHSKLTEEFQSKFNSLLQIGLSPEQISGRLSIEYQALGISTNTLYSWVKKLGYSNLLPRKARPYKKRSSSEAGARLGHDSNWLS